jgi:putative endonuclease
MTNSEITVYILRCSDGLFYTGQTNNIERRLSEHNSGNGGWTSHHYPCSLIHSFIVQNRKHARYFEKKIKNMGAREYLKSVAISSRNSNILIGL